MVSEQMMAADAKSKAAATLLSFRFIRIGDVPGSICSVSVFIFVFRFPFGVVFVFATQSRKFGTKFRKFFKRTQLFETRITQMVTNFVTLDSIGLG